MLDLGNQALDFQQVKLLLPTALVSPTLLVVGVLVVVWELSVLLVILQKVVNSWSQACVFLRVKNPYQR